MAKKVESKSSASKSVKNEKKKSSVKPPLSAKGNGKKAAKNKRLSQPAKTAQGSKVAKRVKVTKATKTGSTVKASKKATSSVRVKKPVPTATPTAKKAVNQAASEAKPKSQSKPAPTPVKVSEIKSSSPARASRAQQKASSEVGSKKVRRSADELLVDRTGDIEAQWQELYERAKGIKPLPYKMSEAFEVRTPIIHKVLGWGIVLSSQNNRLEVLFKDGIRTLVANYKG